MPVFGKKKHHTFVSVPAPGITPKVERGAQLRHFAIRNVSIGKPGFNLPGQCYAVPSDGFKLPIINKVNYVVVVAPQGLLNKLQPANLIANLCGHPPGYLLNRNAKLTPGLNLTVYRYIPGNPNRFQYPGSLRCSWYNCNPHLTQQNS